jgi:putative hydrolase of the HAD superfamily
MEDLVQTMPTTFVSSPLSKYILIDLGGVLINDYLPAAATTWGARLGITPQQFLAALFGGSEDQVLVGRVSESAWWDIVASRLGLTPQSLADLRRDLAGRQAWNPELVALLRRLRGRVRTGIVSNCTPGTRDMMTEAGLLGIVDQLALSCEVGCTKPDPRIYQAALAALSARPEATLFIDDTAGHVRAAEALGMTGHVHTGSAGTIARIEEFLATG